jgi:hypothetical protein
MAPGPSGLEPFFFLLTMPRPNPKPIALLAALVIAVAASGCGGGDDEPVTSGGSAAAVPAQAEPSTPGKREAKKKASGKKGTTGKKKADESKRSTEDEARELARKLAKSGTPIPADSPVAREVLKSLTKNRGKKGKNRARAVDKAIEEVLAQPQGGGGSSSGGQPGGGSVEEILEQIQK